jgi:Na+/melibiose symporter-like transporter
MIGQKKGKVKRSWLRSILWWHPDFMKFWTGQTISVFGSMVGGAAMSFVAILIDAASFVVSAISVGVIRAREAAIIPEAEHNLRSEIAAGLQEVWGKPLLRASAVAFLIHNLSGGMYGALVVLYMSRGLGFLPGLLGVIWAVGGLSSFLGAALAPRLTDRLGIGRVMTIGLTMAGLSGFFVPLASGATWLSALLLVLAQLGDGFYVAYEINLVSLRQAVAHERLLGRVNATMRFLALGATLAGSLLGGALGEALGPRLVLVIGAVGTLLGALYLGLSPIRKVKR